jgi:hypothetical protein
MKEWNAHTDSQLAAIELASMFEDKLKLLENEEQMLTATLRELYAQNMKEPVAKDEGYTPFQLRTPPSVEPPKSAISKLIKNFKDGKRRDIERKLEEVREQLKKLSNQVFDMRAKNPNFKATVVECHTALYRADLARTKTVMLSQLCPEMVRRMRQEGLNSKELSVASSTFEELEHLVKRINACVQQNTLQTLREHKDKCADENEKMLAREFSSISEYGQRLAVINIERKHADEVLKVGPQHERLLDLLAALPRSSNASQTEAAREDALTANFANGYWQMPLETITWATVFEFVSEMNKLPFTGKVLVHKPDKPLKRPITIKAIAAS